jgi:hypothetical protein
MVSESEGVIGAAHRDDATCASAEERFSNAVISCVLERRDRCAEDQATSEIWRGLDSIAMGRKTMIVNNFLLIQDGAWKEWVVPERKELLSWFVVNNTASTEV